MDFLLFDIKLQVRVRNPSMMYSKLYAILVALVVVTAAVADTLVSPITSQIFRCSC